MIKHIIRPYIAKRQAEINFLNRARLKNKDISLICSNCIGGIIYHSLGLRFNSPFINLYMTGEDYIKALENWQDFLGTEIVEDTTEIKPYPIGVGYLGIKVHFLHYAMFDEAIEKWNRRKVRVKADNIAFMFDYAGGDMSLLERFDRLPFEHKVVFTADKCPNIKSAVCLKGYKNYCRLCRLYKKFTKKNWSPNIWMMQNRITGKRFIDQFDYVSWFNSISSESDEC